QERLATLLLARPGSERVLDLLESGKHDRLISGKCLVQRRILRPQVRAQRAARKQRYSQRQPHSVGLRAIEQIARAERFQADRATQRERRIQRRLRDAHLRALDRKSTRLNSSHVKISYAVFCLKK